MNNKTKKQLNISIKLRGDNVYDIYIGKDWVASRGSYLAAAQMVKELIEIVMKGE